MPLDKRTAPFRADLAAAHLRGQVEAPRYAEGHHRTVCTPLAALRREPRPDAPLDTEALMGERFTVYDETEGWAWGQLEGDGYVGYLSCEALREVSPAPNHRISVLRTFIYPGPSLKLPPIGYLSLNASVATTGTDGDYTRLATGGFVYTRHLAGLDALETDFVAVAERFMGTPYLWGGKSSLGIDCSGLVQTALATGGIKAPRDADMQEAALGSPVAITPDLTGLQRGDLVFWKGHVGIMLDAKTLLHANGFMMLTGTEPLRTAAERILAKENAPVRTVKRLSGKLR